MTVSKLPDGRYLVDLRPQGREGKRIWKRFPIKSEAHNMSAGLLAITTTKNGKSDLLTAESSVSSLNSGTR